MDDSHLTIANFSISKILLTSIGTAITGSIVTIFNFDSLSIEIKCVIILAFIVVILLIDLVLLFIREREITYELKYLTRINKDLVQKTNNLEKIANNIIEKNANLFKEVSVESQIT